MKDNIKVKGQLGLYLQWPLFLSVLLVLMNLVVGAIYIQAGLAMSMFTVVYLLFAGWIYLFRRNRLMAGLVEFSAEYSWIQKKMLADLDLPYAVADENGRLLWLNKEFQRIICEEKGSSKNITALFPVMGKEVLETDQPVIHVHGTYGEKKYRIDVKPVSMDENSSQVTDLLGVDQRQQKLVAIYLFDETEILKYRQEIYDQKMVAGLIYLDNYDEALESVEEVRRSLLIALIDRKINKYITGFAGVVKKLEKDKYFFTIKQRYVAELQEQRFLLLEEVKTVNIGNEMAVTLSIGLGMNGDTYNQNYEFARMAIDMALGRGGDQAVIKDPEKIQYYGGKSQQLEKTTRVKARVKAHALRELMETKDRILIMGHKMADIDSFGAATGIYRIPHH